jgi:uncharacterized protein involved in exopolysaccharide biosynthesis
MQTYNNHVNNVPAGEQELNDVLRENNDLTRQYQELSSKLSAARLSESAENQQKGSQFEIVDPASLPLTPTKPSKPSMWTSLMLTSIGKRVPSLRRPSTSLRLPGGPYSLQLRSY